MFRIKKSLHTILLCIPQLDMRKHRWHKETRLLIQPATLMLWQKSSISTHIAKVEAMSLLQFKNKKISWLNSQFTKKKRIPNSHWTLLSRPRRAGLTFSLRLITIRVLISSQSYLLSCPKKTWLLYSFKLKSKIYNHEKAHKSNTKTTKRNKKQKFKD